MLASTPGSFRRIGALVPPLLLSGCLVSFNDYPLGELEEASAGESSGGASSSPGGMSAGTSTRGGTAAAGSEATAGSGEGGSPDPGASAPATLIDDFEDGDSYIFARQGRSGSWYAANDGNGMQTPAGPNILPVPLNPPRGGSQHALHTFGGPFQTWGALVGVALAADGGAEGPYDLTDFRGVRFWVRLGSGSFVAARQVRVNFPTPATTAGGGCFMCNDHFGVDVPLSAQWTQREVLFSSLKQDGWGVPQIAEPDLARVEAIQFLFAQGVAFDLWVDDIELF